MDLPENVRKALGWKSEEEKKADEAEKFPQHAVEWDLKDDSEKKLTETLRKFLDASPKAAVLRLVVVVRGNGAEWNKAFVYDREKKQLLAMTRTLPPQGVVESYQSFFWASVTEEQIRKGIPWFDERGEPLKGVVTKNGAAPFEPPITYKEHPDLTEWP